MTIQLKLDVAALNTLFPEGTEARVELQSAVIAAFTRKHLKETALGNDVHKAINEAKREILENLEQAKREVQIQTLKELGLRKDWAGSFIMLGNENTLIRSLISAAVKEALNSEIRNTIAESITKQIERHRGTIQHDIQVALNRIVVEEVTEAVKTKINNAMSQL